MKVATTVEQYCARFRNAVAAGQLNELLQVWSPQDTAADTRYQYRDYLGDTHILLHGEVNGFLTGLEHERQTASNR